MFCHQKLIIMKASALAVLSGRSDITEFEATYDSLFGSNTSASDKKEVAQAAFDLCSYNKPCKVAKRIELADLFIRKLPEYKQTLMVKKIDHYYSQSDFDNGLLTAEDYINEFGLDVEVATLKAQLLMSQDYETNFEAIEGLMEFLKNEALGG